VDSGPHEARRTGTICWVRAAIDRALAAHGDVASRRQLLRVVTPGELDAEIRAGQLVTPFRRAYCRPWVAESDDVLDRAALLSIGSPAALAALTALRRWDLPAPVTDLRHVAVPVTRHPRSREGLVVHRLTRTPRQVLLHGLPTATIPEAVVGSWGLLVGAAARAPALQALRERRAKVAAVRAAMTGRTVPRRAELLDLLDLLDGGCESELELWGYRHVFDAPGLRHGKRQVIVRIGDKVFRLDLAYEEEMLAVELDGRTYHAAPNQWERDIRRDGLLATVGWQTVRYSHRRLTTDVAGCRRQTLDILAARRRTRRIA
jgi:very-short-patch-repair endonuclease